MKNFKTVLAVLSLLASFSVRSQITINFCPVSKTQATPKGFSSTLEIINNTGVVLDLSANDFNMNWPSLVSLPWPFSDGVQNGINWSFKINLDYPGTLAVGATASKQVSNAIFSGALQFPTGGTFTQGGQIYTVTVNNCNKTEAYELYDETFEFNRDCFISSPTSNMCLGEAAMEVWQGEGVFDAMVPTDRPSWAIAVMVAHRLFTNLVGVEMATANFWTATALNESRMVCDPTIVPNTANHWPINSLANSGTGVDIRTDNCFQVLNIGYTQLENNQPDLFAQTNAYGTANFNNVIAGGRWETGALAVTYYHSQNIKYWNQIQCLNLQQVHKDAVDPYATEKILYHAFHDGFNSGTTLIQDIRGNYNAAISAANMNDVIGTGGTWSNLGGGSSQKVANFTSLLEGGSFNLYPTNRDDQTNEYYGCYNASIGWNDIIFYLDKIKILYPKVMDANVQALIKAVFDGLNGGGNVQFTDLGPVIDEIVIQMGGHDPSSYLATQYSASLTCNNEALEVTLKTIDTLCPGESGFLDVWLAGTADFEVHIEFPDGSVKQYTGISSSPYSIPITQPGQYRVVYLEDAIKIGDVNCNVATVTVESKNGSAVGWDKSNLDATKNCATGDLIVTKTGTEQVTIKYTKDGVAQTDVVMTANEATKTIASGVVGGKYIITDITPNSCGTPINDTLDFCTDECTKPPYEILTPDTSICAGDTAQVRVAFNGTQPYTLYFTPNGLPQVTVPNITDDFYTIPVAIAGTFTIDSLADNTCTNDTSKSITITVNAVPTLDLGTDTTLCGTSFVLDASTHDSYEWMENSANDKQTFTASIAGTNEYRVKVTNANGCIAKDTIEVTLNAVPVAIDIRDSTLCQDSLPALLDATQTGVTYKWNDNSTGATLSATTGGDYWVIVTENGCSDTDSVAIVVNALPTVDLGADTTLCGTSFVLDANTQVSYEWMENAANNTQIFTANIMGSSEYRVQVTDANGCTARDTINVTLNPTPTAVDIPDASLCLADLPVTLDATQAGMTYKWNDNSTGATLDANAAGDYWVIVTENGCSDTDSVKVTLKGAANVDLGTDTTLCGTSFVLDAQSQATYEWMENSANDQQTFVANLAGLNEYRVKVTNAAGCVSMDTINVTLNAYPTVDLGPDTNEVCPTSYPVSMDATTPGASYLWSDATNGATLDANAQGDYWVIVTVSGCSDTDSVYVKESSSLSLDLRPDTTVCPGQSITLNPIINYSNITYTWSDGSNGTSLTTSTPGKIYLDIVDAGGCAGTDTMELKNDNPLVIDLGADPTNLCFGDTTELQLLPARTGLNYQWSIGGTYIKTDSTLKVWNQGTITYVLDADSAGCTANDDITVTINALPIVDLIPDTFLCVGAKATLVLDAGAGQTAYAWSDGSNGQTLTVDKKGQYKVTVTDANTCVASDSLIVDEKTATPVVITGGDKTICPKGNAVLTLTTPASPHTQATWLWKNDNSTNPSKSYKVENRNDGDVVEVILFYTNEFGCLSSDTSQVNVSNVLAVSGLDDESICVGESHSFATDFSSASNASDYEYKWHDNSTASQFSFTNVGMSDHGTVVSVEVTDVVNGCSNTVDATLTVNKLPNPSMGNDTACIGTAVSINAGLSAVTHGFSWTQDGQIIANANGASQTNDGSKAGVFTYVVTATELATGCSHDTTAKIVIAALPVVDLGTATPKCEGDAVTLPSTGGKYNTTDYSHTWALDGNTINGETGNTYQASVSGEYRLTVIENATNCSNNAQLSLVFESKPSVELTIDDSVICAGASAVLTATEVNSNYNYHWSYLEPGGTRPLLLRDSGPTSWTTEDAGAYTLETVTKAGGCSHTSAPITVELRDLPQSGLQSDTVVCFESMRDGAMTLNANPDVLRAKFSWSNGDTTQIISITERGGYSVVITDDEGCETEDEVFIREDCLPNAFVPMAFTPNGDGKNDTWGIEGRGIETMEVYVYNRWGELVWKGDEKSDRWDGTFYNEPVAEDVYVWKLTYTYSNVHDSEKSRSQTGIVTVVR